MRSEMIKVPRRTARAPFHFRETRSRLHSFLIHYIIMASKRRVILQVSSSDSDQSPSSSPLSTPVSTKKRVKVRTKTELKPGTHPCENNSLAKEFYSFLGVNDTGSAVFKCNICKSK